VNPFAFDWDAPVDDVERDRLLNSAAEHIARRGLSVPAQWLLEVHRPLANIAGQFAITLSPVLACVFTGGAADMQKYTMLLRDRANIDRLIALIDEKTAEAPVAAR
jgi:hypothetical protein